MAEKTVKKTRRVTATRSSTPSSMSLDSIQASTAKFTLIETDRLVVTKGDQGVGASSGSGEMANNKLLTLFMVLLPIATFFLGYFYGQHKLLSGGGGVATTANAQSFSAYAKTIGLDEKQFNNCMADGQFASEVSSDLAFAQTVNATGTPTFFINGQIMVGALPYEAFQGVIEGMRSGNRQAVVSALEPYQQPDADGNPGTVDEVVSNEVWQQIVGNPAATEGDSSAPITLVEFTDYQCPYCSRHFSQTSPLIKRDYIDTGLVYHVIRDLPLPFHQNATKAAEAARCAGDQDKYWDMYDVLFTKQNEWSNWTI